MNAEVVPCLCQVLLISDPKANKAAASMDVNSGHFNDPVRLVSATAVFICVCDCI